MVLKDIIELMKAVQKTDFDCFELKDQDFSLKLERNQKRVEFSVGSPDGSALPPLITRELRPATYRHPEQVVIEEVKGVAPEEAVIEKAEEGKTILSPLVGIYHELPNDRVIKKGDFVKKGVPVCLIEAMKLMNEVAMPEDGEIISVELKDGDTVEYDQVLFRYK